VDKKQKQAIRCISNANYNDPTAPLFLASKILPLKQLIRLEKAKFMFKNVNNRLPSSFNNIWTLNNTHQGERELRNTNSLIIPFHHFESLKKMPIFDLPITWNNLGETKNITSFSTFKFNLK
jgi:hypothetical protein